MAQRHYYVDQNHSDYVIFDYDDFLAVGDSIDTSTITSDSGITVDSTTQNARNIRVDFTVGDAYAVLKIYCSITSVAGSEDSDEVNIHIVESTDQVWRERTGTLYTPKYIYPGDILFPEYETLTVAEIDFGDLKDVVSFKELLEKTTDERTADRPARQPVLRAIQLAESEVDSYIGVKFSIDALPYTSKPPAVVGAALTIFKYRLFARRQHVPPDLVLQYNNAVRFLKDISSGKAGIKDSSNNTLSKSSVDRVARANESERLFSYANRSASGSPLNRWD